MTPKLFEIHWPSEGGPDGARLGYEGYAPTPNFNPRHWLDAGYDGCRVYGHGAQLHAGRATATVIIDSPAQHVELVEFGIKCGDPRGLLCGGIAERKPIRVDLTGCTVSGPGKWGDHNYQRGGRRYQTTYRGITGEHCDYAHGNDGKGSLFEECQFLESAGEGVKRTNRPWWGAYPEGRIPGKHARIDATRWFGRAPVAVKHCLFEDLGAGVVAQGSSEDILIHGCVFKVDDHAIGIEGAPEFYKMGQDPGPEAVAGIPGVDFCNGKVTIERCLILGTAATAVVSGNLLFLAGCEELILRECAIYGHGVFQIGTKRPQDKMGKVTIEGCNTPELRRLAEEHGGDTFRVPALKGMFSGSLTARHES